LFVVTFFAFDKKEAGARFVNGLFLFSHNFPLLN
jgi:hypothetical protein